MKVTIIIPCYNASAYIASSISSIQSQTLTDWEMIIVDDGSTDNSADIVQQFSNKDPRIKLVQKANGGTASARKLGLEHATGEYIQFLDADDSIDTDKLSIQVRFMQQHSLDVSYTDWCMIDTNGKKDATRGLQCSLIRLLCFWGPLGTIPLHSFMYKHAFLKAHQITIPTHIKEREDWDFHLSVFSHHPKAKRIEKYCGAFYTKSPTGKTTGASHDTVQLGTFRYILYKTHQEHGYKKLLLNLRFSMELCIWFYRLIRLDTKRQLAIYISLKNSVDFWKTWIIGICMLPISLPITLISILTNKLQQRSTL